MASKISAEQQLYEIKSKTVPIHESVYGRSPLFKPLSFAPKHYSEVEVFQHQQIYRENYHNPALKELMEAATEVLERIKNAEETGLEETSLAETSLKKEAGF